MNQKYGTLQIAFHWAVFILVACAYAAMELKGFADRGSSARALMLTVHYTCGVSVLILMLIRIGLRFTAAAPAIIPTPERWQSLSAHIVHGVLYILFIGLPLLGVLALYFGGHAWSFFGYAMPVSSPPNFDLQDSVKDLHELIANTGYFIIGLHALAALFHHYVVRDNTLIRMLPGKWGNQRR